MKLTRLAPTSILLLASTGAWADGGGSFIVKGKAFELKSAYAQTCPDPFDSSRSSTMIAFSSRPFDDHQIATAEDPAGALSAALHAFSSGEERPTKVQITLSREKPESPVQLISYTIPGLSSQASARNLTVELKHNDGKRVEGTLRSNDEAAKTAKFGGGFFELHFALDVHPDSGC